MNFIIINGEIVHKDETNLSFLFEDEPFILNQKIWFGFGGIPLFNENLDLILQQIEVLKLPIPSILKNKRELFRITKRMLNKNKFYRSGFVHLQLFWTGLQVNSVLTSIAFPEFEFPFSMHGLLVNYSEIRKQSFNPYNAFAFNNLSAWKIQETQLYHTQFQNSILLNEKDTICEALRANIYFVKDKTLITPSLETGCYEDVLRNIILELAIKLHLNVIESKSIRKADVFEMDEIFLASEENGIQWILGVENKRFVHHYSAKLHEKLNNYINGKVV